MDPLKAIETVCRHLAETPGKTGAILGGKRELVRHCLHEALDRHPGKLNKTELCATFPNGSRLLWARDELRTRGVRASAIVDFGDVSGECVDRVTSLGRELLIQI